MVTYIQSTNEMTMECDGDGCFEVIELTGDWHTCIADAKEEGWTVTKEDDEWKHYCRHCNNNPVEDIFGEIK